MKHKLPLSGLLLALFLACTSDSEDGLGSGQAAACVAGKVEPCACPGTAVQGAQTCLPSGVFGACEGCPGGTAGAGGAGQGGENQGGSAPGGEGGADVFGPGGTNAGGSTTAGNGGSATSGNGGSATSGSGGSAAGGTDQDGDGWTTTQGDCNDKDPTVNPGAAELLEVDFLGKPKAEQIDNDCDGKALQPSEPTACDAGLGPLLNDPFDGARAMGLCKVKVDEASKKWGVISATLSDISSEPLSGGLKATGKAREHAFGLLPDLGPKTPSREGQRLFALSSGIARAPGQPGWSEVSDPLSYSKNYTSGQPNGFPKASTCATPGTPNDGVALDLKIRVPSNARSMRFKYRFFAADYPAYTCDQFNDVFAVLMSPSPLGAGDPMADGQNLSANIVFEDTSGGKKTIGVNNETFFSACEPGAKTGVYPNCKTGNGAQLEGSGFETHGATSWLVNQTSVPPGGILYLRFAIWDSADGILDSTVVIDDFEWSTSDPQGAKNFPESAASGGAGGSGAGGSGGSAGSGGGLFGGSGGSSAGSGLFGGSAGSGTAGSSTAGSSSGGNGSGGAAGVPGPCPDGSCAGPGQCCLNPGPPAQCGQDFSGLLCL